MFNAFASGFAISAALIVAIGSQNAFVLRQGLRREHVGPVVLFCTLADLCLMAAGVAGLGAASQQMPRLATALALGGTLFLGFYGIAALRRASQTADLVAERTGAGFSLGGTLARAAGFTLLNPHVYLDTVLLVGTLGAAQPAGAAVPFVAGAGLASATWFTALGYGGRLLAPIFARPGAWRVLDALVGLTMLVLAAGLATHALTFHG